LLILVAGALLNSATGIVAYLLTLTGRERQALKIFLAALGVDLVLNFLLIPGQRAFGAAIGCAVTVAVWNLAMLVAVRRGLGVDASLIGRPYRAR
jgi:O-antigen/teichoic acid export membrane protein